MSSQTLTTAHDFFEQVLKVNYGRFNSSASSFATAFNAAVSLFHFHEWLFKSKKSELQVKYARSSRLRETSGVLLSSRCPRPDMCGTLPMPRSTSS